ncbi:toxin-antitoxin system YwqK family antitoxin [Turneriella parva]|uniref:MORN variant repeat-containing protein n=1 Tax=Turneriella parva (strain ATCC BAA-1111 / DSM 21527 / NCTC 11395 / H) TaxID=869212 RepID=I4B373_TURPD|nr:hypothetical protein [Turneriella parva]AFM11730.1 hypothetical protein Turpa_1081 [Turneriella parva DSM 21527]
MKVKVSFYTRFSHAILCGLLLLLAGGPAACSKTIEGSDPRISVSGGRLLLAGEPFSGILRQAIGDGSEIRMTPYQNGLEHGRLTVRKNKQLVEERVYEQGKKHGTHKGWHANGNLRFVSTFAHGEYVGDQFTYHDNGQVFEYKKYSPEGKLLVSKIFRQTGQIYTSQAFTAEGAAYGLPGSKLCNPVTQEKAKLQQNQSLTEKDVPL